MALQRGNNNSDRKWMKITDDTQPFPSILLHFGGVMSDGEELPDFSQTMPTPFLESTPVLLPAVDASLLLL